MQIRGGNEKRCTMIIRRITAGMIPTMNEVHINTDEIKKKISETRFSKKAQTYLKRHAKQNVITQIEKLNLLTKLNNIV